MKTPKQTLTAEEKQALATERDANQRVPHADPLPPTDKKKADEVVQETSEESFPASDPPAWTGTTSP